ncbi:hypothetical protein [Nocardioides solisilvae]|uniref:hypothetical protein n=1 Tax=Nocardioides solisilvae TaxID=1542435 RepID=UPI000D742138|nr:hypothetical protein [Nocardioides solisilvae]
MTAPPSSSRTGTVDDPSGAPDRGLRRRLRAAVLAHKTAAPRGHLPPVLRAGLPGPTEETAAWEFRPAPDDPLDHDTRVEVAVALAHRALLRVEAPLLWLSRSGDPGPDQCDLEWQAAACAAWRQLGLAPSFVVLTRHGWWHHPSGASQTWTRLRRRS